MRAAAMVTLIFPNYAASDNLRAFGLSFVAVADSGMRVSSFMYNAVKEAWWLTRK